MGCCSQRCRQFMLLLWKNFKLQIRRPIGTAFELVIPPLAVIFIIGLRFGIPELRAEERCFVTFDSDTLTVSSMQNYTIFYAPRNQTPDSLVNLIQSKLPNSLHGGRLVPLDTEEDILEMINSIGRDNLQPFPDGSPVESGCFIGGVGVVFDNLESNAIEYTLRFRHEVGQRNTWFTDVVVSTFQLAGPRVNNFYLSEGFLHLETIVGLSIVEWKSGKSLNVTTAVRQFPHPEYSQDLFLSIISFILPFPIVLALLYSAGVFVKELVLEKQTRIRELMFMMGLSQWVLWSTWYLKQFIFLFISIVVMTALLKLGQVFPASDFILLLIFFTLFLLSMISFCYLVSVWFNSAQVGFVVGFLAWFINYLPSLFLALRYGDLSLGVKVGFCLLSNTCVGLGVEVLSQLELRQEGLRWGSAASPLSADDDFHMVWVFGMLLLDSILYMVIAWYVNGIKPGQYGVPKPFYFPCLPSYWTGSARRQTTSKVQTLIRNDAMEYDPSAHEEEPPDLEAGISIRNLTKIYNQSFLSRFFNGSKKRQQEQRKVAVDELSLNMYKGQITALLGHNGAGKTTAISILTGLYTPTSGTALVNGYDILGDIDQIRESLGICPQHNVLFDRLTVLEHLSFFIRLKGVWDTERVNEEVAAMMADLQLLDKRNIPASKLSGGMKRKLSVGIALIGGSEVVVLDEPTSGMDPYARRVTWDLLVKHKQGRTVLLTTHHMDEADLLGDRIAILAEGKLRCSGSSLFLKSRYGVGYHMTLAKEPKCDSAEVTQIVQSVVHEAEQVTDVGAELSFVLPSSATAHFPQLFDTLESCKAELGISSFGVSVTTMEEVFMKVGGIEETLETRVIRSASPQATSPFHSPSHHSAGLAAPATIHNSECASIEVQEAVINFRDEDDTSLPGQVVQPSTIDVSEKFIGSSSPSMEKDSGRFTDGRPCYVYTPNRGLTLRVQQFGAMFLKRFYNSLRFVGAMVTQFILPMLFVLSALVLAVTFPNPNQDNPKRSLSLENSALSSNITVFYVQFGDEVDSPLNFSGVDASTLGVTEFLDYTDGVQKVIDETLSNVPNTTRQCCKYEYQMLDQYCATRREEDLIGECGDSDDFGFNTCKQCLSCCTSRQTQQRSCSNPFYQQLSTPETNAFELLPTADAIPFCPAAPQVAFSSANGGNPTGKLDSNNVYVAEKLLMVSEELEPVVFHQRFQAGFAVTRRDPPYSVCSCSLPSNTCNFISPLQRESGEECSSQYSIPPQCNLVWAACIGLRNCSGVTSDCQDFDPPSNSGSGSGSNTGGGAGASCNVPLPGCYIVDGFSANIMNNASCSDPMGLAPNCTAGSQHAVYPDQTEELGVTVWYNNEPYHMSAAALNAFHSLLLKQVTGDNSLSITVYNHPFPRNITAQADTATRNNVGYGIGILVVFGYSFLLASFVLFLVAEKESKAKHLQFVSGVHTTSYWLANLTWDLLSCIVPIIISLILFAAFQVEAYSGEGLTAVLLLFIFTTWSGVPISYCFSFLFSNSLVAYGLLMIFFFFVALVTQTVVILVDTDVADILHYIFLIFPTYGLAVGFDDIYINQISKDICTASVEAMQFCELPSSPIRFVDSVLSFERPGIGIIITYMAVEGLLFCILTLLIERSFFFPEIKRLLVREENSRNEYTLDAGPLLPGEDSDVHAERKRVINGDTTEDEVIVMKNLAKEYSSSVDGCSIRPSKQAVGGISVAIPNAECFGLLGVNGAGKTTTFSILTGDIAMSSGTAVIAGYDIRTHLRDVQQRIGYCPQFDALIERLTGRELLTMFARLRGIPEGQIKEVVETEITRLDLSKHADKRCGRYSGGNKRKLSTAVALVGNPPIVLLDEPTTGMDPTTRRYLWDVLTGITQEGRTIVLTSHSMEECEALCTRLAIMVNGYFKCLGSIQHLKNKYGAGYTLQVKVKLMAPPAEPLKKRRRSLFRAFSRHFSLRQAHSSPGRRAKSYHGRPHPHPIIVRNRSVPEDILGHTELCDVSVEKDQTPGVFNPYDTTSLNIFIREAFPGALLLEEHQGAVTYRIPSANTTWSTVFRQLENNKGRLNIIDYSVSQTTLEQVFINFAKEQEDTDA